MAIDRKNRSLMRLAGRNCMRFQTTMPPIELVAFSVASPDVRKWLGYEEMQFATRDSGRRQLSRGIYEREGMHEQAIGKV